MTQKTNATRIGQFIIATSIALAGAQFVGCASNIKTTFSQSHRVHTTRLKDALAERRTGTNKVSVIKKAPQRPYIVAGTVSAMSETRFGSVKGYSSMLHSLRKKAQALGADAILRPTKRIEKFRAYWPIIGLHQTTEFRLEAEAIIFVSQAERDALLKKGLVVAGLAVSNPMGVLFPTLKRESSKRRRARAKRDARKRRRARCKRSGKCRRKARRKSREKTLLDLIARR